MAGIKKKICLIGDFAVGKTSLTQRYVNQVFSDNYLTTIGVKIDTKIISHGDVECKLVIWDVAGRDSMTPLQSNYLVGAAGFLFIVDGTRRESIDSTKMLIDQVLVKIPEAKFLILVNKNDLVKEWVFSEKDSESFKSNGWDFFFSSAKTGENVDGAFMELTKKMLM